MQKREPFMFKPIVMNPSEITFKSTYILRLINGDMNPFCPNIITISDHFIEFHKRNGYLISVDTKTFNFKNVLGITIDNHIISATVNILTTGNDKIRVHGFSKGEANRIKDLTKQKISESQDRQNQHLANVVSDAINGGAKVSIGDELLKYKQLLDSGAISQQEYETLKMKLINR